MVNAAKTLLVSERHPGSKENSFLDDVLKIEYTHPNAPQLTLVDLPGKSIITVASWYHKHMRTTNPLARIDCGS
jgi:hypothetical protein